MTIVSLMAQDSLGNEVTGRSETTLRGIDDFVTGFLGYENKATNILAAADADPDSPLANIYAGFTWMFLEAAGAEDKARIYLKRAQALGLRANPREQLLLDQLERWIAGDIPAVQRIGETIVDNFPRDLASVKLHQYFSFNRGDARAMLDIARNDQSKGFCLRGMQEEAAPTELSGINDPSMGGGFDGGFGYDGGNGGNERSERPRGSRSRRGEDKPE